MEGGKKSSNNMELDLQDFMIYEKRRKLSPSNQLILIGT